MDNDNSLIFLCYSQIGFKMALGDILVQSSQPGNQPLDYGRVLAFFAFGAIYVGAAQYAIYVW
eukprot:SAG31_NODE_7094_length_1790_cov_1.259018_1_plen_63_part_00